MKFVSKNSNLMVVLKPGLPGNAMLGTSSVNGIYVRFQAGVADVKEQSIIDLMKSNAAFNRDYICADDEIDPYEHMRNDVEPKHTISNINYGHVEKSVSTPKSNALSPELKAFLHEHASRMANEIMKEALPGLVQEGVKHVLEQMSESKTRSALDPVVEGSESLAKKSSGRAKKGTNDIIGVETEAPTV